jgi:AraC-like DNA-binding protein
MLCCLPSGGRVSLPDGTDIEVKPGDFMLAALDYPLRLRLPETGRDATRMVQLARTSLDGLANPFDEAPLRTIPADRPELRLLASYAHAVTQNSLPSMAVRQTVSQHLIDLATLVIGATREAQAIASHRGSRAAQLAFAKAEILRRLAEPDLNVASVAYRLRISPRYLHMLFEQEHMTFSAFVTSRRLARARDMLVRPSHASRRIIDIALDAGFREIRTFNRSFRERYGMSPSECRAQANRLI